MANIKQIIKIDICSQTAHFRIYGNQNFCDSYPLPPPSTVLGILREILGKRPPEPLTIAIKGFFEGMFFDYRTFLSGAFTSRDKIWLEKIVNRKVETKPLYVKVLYKPRYIIYLDAPENHDFYISKLNNPDGYISLGRSEDIAMLKASTVSATKKQAKKPDRVKIENSYLPKEVYGSVPLYIPVCHLKDRNLKMERIYYIQEAISYYEGEYWETSDGDRFLWLIEYIDTESGNLPRVFRE